MCEACTARAAIEAAMEVGRAGHKEIFACDQQHQNSQVQPQQQHTHWIGPLHYCMYYSSTLPNTVYKREEMRASTQK